MELKDSETLKNLTRSFSAECQDGAKYQYMADEAIQQKLSQIATILKSLATNEMAHAKVFYDYVSQNVKVENVMVEIKATYPMGQAPLVEMLKIKAETEKRQAETVYPAFAKMAKKEGFDDVCDMFLEIAKIEANHAMILLELYNKLSNNTLYSEKEPTLYKCTNCGYSDVIKKAWKKCPLCSKDQGMVKITLDCSRKDCHCVTNQTKSNKKSK